MLQYPPVVVRNCGLTRESTTNPLTRKIPKPTPLGTESMLGFSKCVKEFRKRLKSRVIFVEKPLVSIGPTQVEISHSAIVVPPPFGTPHDQSTQPAHLLPIPKPRLTPLQEGNRRVYVRPFRVDNHGVHLPVCHVVIDCAEGQDSVHRGSATYVRQY